MAEGLLAVGTAHQGPARLQIEFEEVATGTTRAGNQEGGLAAIPGGCGQQLHITTGVHHREAITGAEVITANTQGIPVAIDVTIADAGEIKA